MNIIKRNFFRALRAGVFETNEQLEPMSLYKWEQLIQLAERHNVAHHVINSLLLNELHPNFSFPENVQERWKEIRRKSISRPDTEYVFDKNNIRLTNFFLNRRLKRIIDAELHSIDTNTDTLYLLGLYISITSHILIEGIKLDEIIQLGTFLRRSGDKVDYVKFDNWINKLKLRRIITLESSIMIQLFDFSYNEFPFIQKEERKAGKLTLKDINSTTSRDLLFKQGNDIFVHNKNNKATLWHIRHCSRLMKYYPLEVTSNFVHNFASSLSEIEE